jgi:hypothetical protein
MGVDERAQLDVIAHWKPSSLFTCRSARQPSFSRFGSLILPAKARRNAILGVKGLRRHTDCRRLDSCQLLILTGRVFPLMWATPSAQRPRSRSVTDIVNYDKHSVAAPVKYDSLVCVRSLKITSTNCYLSNKNFWHGPCFIWREVSSVINIKMFEYSNRRSF